MVGLYPVKTCSMIAFSRVTLLLERDPLGITTKEVFYVRIGCIGKMPNKLHAKGIGEDGNDVAGH